MRRPIVFRATPERSLSTALAAGATLLVLGLSGVLVPGTELQAAPRPARAASTRDRLGASLARQVARLERRGSAVGIDVATVEGGTTVYSHNPDDLFITASNTKLVTTAAALDALGPGFLFKTRLLARGTVEKAVLHGDLAVVGAGDPGISWRPYPYPQDPFGVFRRWVTALGRAGIERIEGDLFLAYGLFPRPWVNPGWKPENRLQWYQVPVAALGFHENVLHLRAAPGERPGLPARIETLPPIPGFTPLQRVLTTASRKGHGLRVDDQPGGGPLEISGSVRQSAHPLNVYVAVDDPVEYFGRAMAAALNEEGLPIEGVLHPVETLPGLTWREVAVHRSDLLTAVEITNHESQNFYAESLIKLLGAEVCGRGTWERGVEAVSEFLSEVGIEPGSYHLVDGSGLARADRFTPRQLTRLLRYMHSHRWGAEFEGSLPHGGEEGTSLEKRLTDPEIGSRVWAKTGTLDGVSTLSGYVRARSGRLYVFSMLVNGGSVWRARRAQDAVAQALIDNG